VAQERVTSPAAAFAPPLEPAATELDVISERWSAV